MFSQIPWLILSCCHCQKIVSSSGTIHGQWTFRRVSRLNVDSFSMPVILFLNGTLPLTLPRILVLVRKNVGDFPLISFFSVAV